MVLIEALIVSLTLSMGPLDDGSAPESVWWLIDECNSAEQDCCPLTTLNILDDPVNNSQHCFNEGSRPAPSP